ncbi:NFX1-type zinc finger-containing protein 1-like [Saccostrea cucullata]|uniref:NFX1-type zinc finger-containing protein 1-like n=1 Tax=Saccostrea cuccullata TaxID=36930 RepID=UPI002ED29500
MAAKYVASNDSDVEELDIGQQNEKSEEKERYPLHIYSEEDFVDSSQFMESGVPSKISDEEYNYVHSHRGYRCTESRGRPGMHRSSRRGYKSVGHAQSTHGRYEKELHNHRGLNDRGRGRSQGRRNFRRFPFYNQDEEKWTDNENADENLNEGKTHNQVQIRRMGYKRLKDLDSSSRNADEILVALVTKRNGFSSLLSQKLKPDWMILVISLLVKSFRSEKHQTKLELVALLDTSNFIMVNLLLFLGEIELEQIKLQDIEFSSLMENVCSLTQTLIQRMQSHVSQWSILIEYLDRVVDKNSDRILHYKPEVITNMKEFKAVKDGIQKGDYKKTITIPDDDSESLKPPEDFRELSVLPEMKDFDFNEKPFLRANKIKGGYENLDHYLDIQFRLLREDFLRPLRDGIKEYKKQSVSKNLRKKVGDVRIYTNVQIVRPVCRDEGIAHLIRLDMTKLRNVRWESSRRLMYGALLCLSQDGFQNILFASVTDRNERMLENGEIEVKFQEKDLSNVEKATANNLFVVAETTAYFEAYRHVLEGMKEITQEMPFQKYIVHCQANAKPPKYLLSSGVLLYDFSTLLQREDADKIPVDISCSEIKSRDRFEIPILSTSKWPSAETLHLDHSQHKALQLALTKEIALIQGPPGTGKTFLGMKIAQMLLFNRDIWAEKEKQEPILVVCYTNHALDQFLLGIKKYTKKLVRIGSRSKVPELEEYTLTSYRKKAKYARILSQAVYDRKIIFDIWVNQKLDADDDDDDGIYGRYVSLRDIRRRRDKNDCYHDMEDHRKAIESVSRKIKSVKLGILSIEELEAVVSKKHFAELKKENGTSIDEWLEIDREMSLLKSFGKGTEEEKALRKKYDILIQWEQELIRGKKINPIPLKLLNRYQNPWRLNLRQRGSLFKALLSEFRAGVKRHLDIILKQYNNALNHHRMPFAQVEMTRCVQEINYSIAILHASEKEIIDEEVMKSFVHPFLGKLITEIQRYAQSSKAFFLWLCFDGSTESCNRIAEIFEGKIIEDSESDDEDFDDRIIDEDNPHRSNTDWRTNEIESPMTTILSKASVEILSDNLNLSERSTWMEHIFKQHIRIKLKKVLTCSDAMTKNESEDIEDVWDLSLDDRRRLYRYWVDQYIIAKKQSIKETEQEYNEKCKAYKEALDLESVEIMAGADVLGLTTTGAAKFRSILQSIKPKIIIVEEAAEVLESHIVTTINSECQHMILIGDHKQLRPTPTVYKLAKQYNLEISLFERMVTNELNFVTLNLQHRMRPEISVLMKHIYPELKDHPCVLNYDRVRGITSNLFFIDHDEPEEKNLETKSRSNLHEAKFAKRLCRYLLDQDYQPEDIVILTPYTGQVLVLKQEIPKHESGGVKITSVDNFQGEESDIIILSLVRSNEEHKAGFLKIDNRICVALSRARKGLFVIGNFSVFEEESELWQKIIGMVKSEDKFGKALKLRCENHSDFICCVQSDTDFDKMPLGGCGKPCNIYLQCGHQCLQNCHNKDPEHKTYKCTQPCNKTICQLGHICKKQCFKDCGKCMELTRKPMKTCQHENIMPCSEDVSDFKCMQLCNQMLPCQHTCQGKCGECNQMKEHRPCEEICRTVLICGHTMEGPCFQIRARPLCTEKCNVILLCGHACSGACGECMEGRLHIQCQQTCGKTLICGHICKQKCVEGCPSCKKKCEFSCRHTNCTKICGDICDPCERRCARGCKHAKCIKHCNEKCSILPCTFPCVKVRECGHQCPGLCGEKCPPYCKICDNVCVMQSTGQQCCLEEHEQIITLDSCGHTFEAQTLDNYIFNKEKRPYSILDVKTCPSCEKPVNGTDRYKSVYEESRKNIVEITKYLNEKLAYSNFKGEHQRVLKMSKSLGETDETVKRIILPLVKEKTYVPGSHQIQLALIQIEILSAVHKILQLMSGSVIEGTKEEKHVATKLYVIRDWLLKSVETRYEKGQKHHIVVDRSCFTKQEIQNVSSILKELVYLVEFLLLSNSESLSGENIYMITYGSKIRPFLAGKSPLDDELKKILNLIAIKSGNEIVWGETITKNIESSFANSFKATWEKGVWFKCKYGHISHLPNGKGKCGSCNIKITTVVSLKGPNTVPTLSIAGEIGKIWKPSAQSYRDDQNRKDKKGFKGQSKQMNRDSHRGVQDRQQAKRLNYREAKESDATQDTLKEKNIELKMDPAIIKRCDKGHIMRTDESTCTYCNPQRSKAWAEQYKSWS